jgi:phage terminase large subunit
MPANNEFHFNHLYREVFTTKARYILCWGGRARGGSHFGTDYFLFKMTQPEYFRGAFLRSVYGDIRDSLFKDWSDRLETSSFNPAEFVVNDGKMAAMYKPTRNSFISKGFKKSSGNASAKLKSIAGITHILIEEAEEVNEDDFNKLDDSIRTNRIENIQIILLFNPPSKNHWLIKRFFNLLDSGILDDNGKPIPYYKAVPKVNADVLIIQSNYLDNLKNLNEKTIKKYQDYGRPDSPFYSEEKFFVDVMGMVPEGARGRIYKNWKPVTNTFFESLPYPSYYGLDFGYSDDPVALVEIKTHNNKNFWREIIYEAGLTNPALAAKMDAKKVDKKKPMYADNSEPKSIQELRNLGYKKVIPADKGPDSLLFGIKLVSSMENYATEESTNLWYENEEYKWHLDLNKEPTNTPEDKHNHLKDAGRYAITTHRKSKGTKVSQNNEPSPLDWID